MERNVWFVAGCSLTNQASSSSFQDELPPPLQHSVVITIDPRLFQADGSSEVKVGKHVENLLHDIMKIITRDGTRAPF
jgi:hypothetical protein